MHLRMIFQWNMRTELYNQFSMTVVPEFVPAWVVVIDQLVGWGETNHSLSSCVESLELGNI